MKIAVSACLLGKPVRYDGTSRPCCAVQALAAEHELVPICPECAGGLEIPRPPSEIVSGALPGSGQVLRVESADGADVTAQFETGSRLVLEQVLREGCELAVLKAKSPSCGTGYIYDGSFTGTLAKGEGTCARLLLQAGIAVIDERRLADEGLPDRPGSQPRLGERLSPFG